MSIKISEDKNILKYLEKRNLLSQYKKTKKYILSLENIYEKLKKRKPKKDGIYQFRINKQYRARCVFSKKHPDTIVVYKISDHQN